jgi:DNA invertase Pin-like site-specific DNA recombinase
MIGQSSLNVLFGLPNTSACRRTIKNIRRKPIRRDQAICRARGIEIVRTYADAGKSGLSVEGRDALKQLIADVSGRPRRL